MASFEFKLPDVGEGLHEAEIVKWLVAPGDMVREDQPIVEVQTDKVTVELTSPVKGKVASLHGGEGETVHVGNVIIVFETEGGAPAAPKADAPAAAHPGTAPAPAAPAAAVSPQAPVQPAFGASQEGSAVPSAPIPATAPAAVATAVTTVTAAPEGTRALASPSTRRVARELGIDINRVPGSGPAGRVTTEDVQSFATGPRNGVATAAAPGAAAAVPAAAPAPPPAVPGERIPLKGIRRTIAQRMVAAKHTASHVTVVDEFDASELVALRERAKPMAAAKGIKLSYLPFVLKALVAALKEFPYLNASIDDAKQEIVLHKEYNIGIAVDTDSGLLVPVVHGADGKTILQIAEEINALADKARAGKLTLPELQGGTCSISNMGSVGAGLFFTPVINVPEVAILGVGKLDDRAVVREGQIVVRKMQYLSLSFDHRLVDGALATRFLARVLQFLGNPTLLLMEMI